MALATVAVKGEAHGAAEPAEVRSYIDDMVETSQGEVTAQSHLMDEADVIYRYHWAVVDARIRRRSSRSSMPAWSWSATTHSTG